MKFDKLFLQIYFLSRIQKLLTSYILKLPKHPIFLTTLTSRNTIFFPYFSKMMSIHRSLVWSIIPTNPSSSSFFSSNSTLSNPIPFPFLSANSRRIGPYRKHVSEIFFLKILTWLFCIQILLNCVHLNIENIAHFCRGPLKTNSLNSSSPLFPDLKPYDRD